MEYSEALSRTSFTLYGYDDYATNISLFVPVTTNSITRYLSDAPALTNETWGATEQTNWMAVAGTNWVDDLILDWWFYERADWVAKDDLNPILHPDPLPQYATHAEATNAAVAVMTAAKELHADSFTNLIWRTVWSNGWCWSVAYTNTP